MDVYDRCTNLGKILPIVLPSMVEAENFSDHPLNFKSVIAQSVYPLEYGLQNPGALLLL
jgi:hypothetical protein